MRKRSSSGAQAEKQRRGVDSSNGPFQLTTRSVEAERVRVSDMSELAFFLAKLFLGSELRAKPERSLLVVVSDNNRAERLFSDLRFFLHSENEDSSRVCSFFGWEILPFDALSPPSSVSGSRLYTLEQLRSGVPTVVVGTVDALLQRLVPPELFSSTVGTLTLGEKLEREALEDRLDRGGYQRASLVEEVGQMSVRGAVVDFFPPGTERPLRVELFSGRIDSIREFDTGTQRSIGERSAVRVLPVKEFFFESGERGEGFDRLRARASELGLPLRSAKIIEEALLESLPYPGIEYLQTFFAWTSSTIWNYLPQHTVLAIVDEPAVATAVDEYSALVDERIERAVSEGRIAPKSEDAFQTAQEFYSETRRYEQIFLDTSTILRAHEIEVQDEIVPEANAVSRTVFTLQGMLSALKASRQKERPFLPLADEIKHRIGQGYRIALICSHASRERRLRELLEGYDLHTTLRETSFLSWLADYAIPRRELSILHGELGAGIRSSADRFVLIPEQDIFPDVSTRRHTASAQNIRRFLGTVSQLKEDDYIVHLDHGIGIYRGLRQIDVDGKTADFLHLEYAEGAKLFLPVENIGKIQKYAAADAKRPALSKLGGKSWSITKAKVKENIAELAGQLLKVLAQRELSSGLAFEAPDEQDRAFADSFPYEETPDQTKAIADILSDLSRGKPMDRLVCGDVGYGKTEVALRGIYKVVSSGKQVAVLVPTTILAEQHEKTFRNRFTDQPVRIECVSRFNHPSENKAILTDVAAGKVDIVIGTHRLLQRDVLFKDLGLLVIDEEHRFGVAHKERLKRMRADVHVLTLTATPIPRTLHMSLSGIRELSIIETPPVDRQVIRTYLATYTDSIVREAILRELGRSGQVFYLHNRVENIKAVCDQVAELVPEARVEFAHGQMKDAELERIMHRFVAGEIDVIVTTTIVESGLDIPNANTIIIRHAERFGLAELYQLRGRVGRSNRRAYAYLLVPDPKTLGADAKKRLQVLQSLDDLGIGFRLAIQDMEIRGAGNLLGKNQSGHIELVGYELYSRILKEAVEELRRSRAGIEPRKEERIEVDPEVRIGFPAHIPPWYVPDVAERLLLYQRLIELRHEQDGREALEEIADRFGNPPEDVEILIELMVFRALLRRFGIVSANYRNGSLHLAFHPLAAPRPDKAVALVKSSQGRVRLTPSMSLNIKLEAEEITSPKVLTEKTEEILGHFS